MTMAQVISCTWHNEWKEINDLTGMSGIRFDETVTLNTVILHIFESLWDRAYSLSSPKLVAKLEKEK